MPAKTSNSPLLKDGTFEVKRVIELAFFDLTGERAKTKNTSNKQYHAELHLSKTSPQAQIYTMWGPTGGHQTEDWRHYTTLADAEKDFNSIIKSKTKKGYREIDVAQRAIGSQEAKSITKVVELKNLDDTGLPKSILHKETQRLVSELMGATNQFVIKTLKCPLGQLTNKQIDDGRARLNSAKDIVEKNKISQNDKDKLLELTNEFYSLIPHNLGSGARGQMTELLLNTKEKINQKEYDLDTLLDAKDLNIELTGNDVDLKYKSLDTEISFIDHSDVLFNWLGRMIHETRASNHRHLGNITLLNAWYINRNGERDKFNNTAERIAKECGKQVYPDKMETLVKTRPDGNPDLFKKANVIPLFHGTRTENLTGILKKGLLIRPSGVVLCGSMYGNGIYKSSNSSKSINYTSIQNSYWAKGSANKAYLFLSDSALGNTYIANRSGNYTAKSIYPNHSIWAKAGSSVINDEMILFSTTQHNLKYLLEFTCK